MSHHFNIKLGQLIDTVMGNIFWKNLVWFGKLDSRSRTVLIYRPTTIIRKPITMKL